MEAPSASCGDWQMIDPEEAVDVYGSSAAATHHDGDSGEAALRAGGSGTTEDIMINSMGDDIAKWPWREFRIRNGCPVSPREVAAGIVSGIYEVVGFIRNPEMERVYKQMLEWRGNTAQNRRVREPSRFPDFLGFMSDRGFQPAFQQCLTRPMKESELAFLLSVTSGCLESVRQLGFHVDERAWFVYRKTQKKQALKSTQGCSECPYGKISGSIGRGDVEI